MIVATAGHIDHGKTLLVKALTGVDTDRLPEERARGISIDLGFASLACGDGSSVGFIDVPGHERFVRNMLAGVCGIDFALVVVAADDGVMPQSIEHAHILDLLEVSRGALVMTKIDRVSEARLGEACGEALNMLRRSRLSGFPVIPVSAVTGQGIPELRAYLLQEAAKSTSRFSEGHYFRLAVDRAFVVAGSGTVVTGTVYSGRVRIGDQLVLSRTGSAVRVRGIQIHGSPSKQAFAGQRCALNLARTDVASASRGDWVLDPALQGLTKRIDARLTILASQSRSLEHWSPVHLHLGSTHVTGRIAIAGDAPIAPGASSIVQLRLDEPIGALHGDRFILRDQSATRTLGGGRVIDPFPIANGRKDAVRLSRLAALEQSTAELALAALVKGKGHGVDLAWFHRTLNNAPERAAAVEAKAGIVAVGRQKRIGISTAERTRLMDAFVASLAAAHVRDPHVDSHEIEPLRGSLGNPSITADGFECLMRALIDAGRVGWNGSRVRLRGYRAASNPAEAALWPRISLALEASGFSPPTVHELAVGLCLPDDLVSKVLHQRAKAGDAVKVAPDRFYLRPTLATLGAIAEEMARSLPAGLFTAGQYRDAIGVGRSVAIRILEHFDTLGLTQRNGDARRFRKDPASTLGSSASHQERP